MLVRLRLAALIFVCACSKNLPPAFVSAATGAEQAYRRAEYAKAAEQWQKAAALAPNARERDEANYRQALALRRAGKAAEAEAVYRALEAGHGERAERAAYSRAESTLARGDEKTGYALLGAAIRRFPNSGLAPGATKKILAHLAETQSASAELEELERLITQLQGTELEEGLLFTRARWLETHGEPARARAAFQALVSRFPYPRGKFWDDALLASAHIDETEGRFQSAIVDLERMLAERELARTMGSYERPNFAVARFRIAELYRDRLNDPRRAREHFRRVWRDHPTSLLRDDALFEEALIALRNADRAAACDPARLLLDNEADSRFADCAPLLCPALPAKSQCRSYLQDRIRQAAEPAVSAAGSPYSSSSR